MEENMAIITDTGVSEGPDDDGVMALLGAGIPLSLLMDLVDAEGPQSRDLIDHEVGDSEWLAWSRQHAHSAA
jgi:hypothetical protein